MSIATAAAWSSLFTPNMFTPDLPVSELKIDAHNCEADVERVCTHSAYRRRGFARAAIQECLYRLQAMGMQRAAIAGYSKAAVALYSSLGAQSEMKCFTYESGPHLKLVM